MYLSTEVDIYWQAIRFHWLLIKILDVFLHSGYVGRHRLHISGCFVQCAFATIKLQDKTESVHQLLQHKARFQMRFRLIVTLQHTFSTLWEDNLILQPAAIIFLLLQNLSQFYSLLVGNGYLPLSFLVVVLLHIQQVFPLCNGGIPFPDFLVGFSKLLEAWRNETGIQNLVLLKCTIQCIFLHFITFLIQKLVCANLSQHVFNQQKYKVKVSAFTSAHWCMSASWCFICLMVFSHWWMSCRVSRWVCCKFSVVLSKAICLTSTIKKHFTDTV